MSDIPEAVPAGAAGSAPAVEVKHRGLITLSIMAATIMQVLDTTIANVALPSMTGDLGASQDTITWVLTSYIVASAIMTPVTGWLADRYGVSWQIVPQALLDMLNKKDNAAAQRAMAAMLGMKKLDIAALQRAYRNQGESL